MTIGIMTVLLFGSMFIVLLTGLPVVFALGGLATLFSIVLFGFNSSIGIFMTTWSGFTSEILLSIPLFLLMASVLQHSRMADDFYDLFQKWMGGLKGGLSIGTVLICMIFAALTGTSGAATVSMGLIAIPSMMNRGYNKHLAIGCVAASGVLGIIIPPSVIMILYSLIAHVGIGKMFMGGILPGLTAGVLFCIYIGIRCYLNPELGPPVPPEERAGYREKMNALKALVLPFCLIAAVLGSIWTGIATPTEGAAIGAFGSYLCVIITKRFTLAFVQKTVIQALELTVMVMWILIAATVFSNFYTQLGAREAIESIVLGLDVTPWTIIILMALSLFILGTIMDDYAILMLVGPIYAPLVVKLGFDPLWFGIVFILDLSQAYLTPPFGFNLFYIKSITPYIEKETGQKITLFDIYKSVIPFVCLQVLNFILLLLFPALATWLPSVLSD